jgi:hypothetical protein
VGNISRGDHTRIFNISGGTDILIERNLIVIPQDVIPKDASMQVVLFSDWNGSADGVTVDQNRIFVEGKAASGHAVKRDEDGTYGMGPGWGNATNVRFDANVYLKHGEVEPVEPTAKMVKAAGLAGIDWEGPGFDAARDGGKVELVNEFFEAHRGWMRELFRQARVM